jgi:hypothetical protein
MNMKTKTIVMGALVLMIGAAAVSAQEYVSAAEREAITFMLEEEKMARDVYQVLGAEWDARVFANIAEAEQVHMDQVTDLAEQFSIPIPSTIDTLGVFQNQELQTLYNALIAQGMASYQGAVEVGVMIEETDIADLYASLEIVENAQIRATFERLLAGSENHLAAFSRQQDTAVSGNGRGGRNGRSADNRSGQDGRSTASRGRR